MTYDPWRRQRYPGEPSSAAKPYKAMTREEKLAFYDSHNGGTRLSNDMNQRLYGVCGCQYCAETRKIWANPNLAPINDQRRKGDHAMSSINVCDISSDLVSGVALGSVTLVTSSDHGVMETIHKEVCPACVEAIRIVLEAATEPHNRGKAFTKAWQRPQEKYDTSEEDNDTRRIIRMIVEETHAAQKAIESQRTLEVPDESTGRHTKADPNAGE